MKITQLYSCFVLTASSGLGIYKNFFPFDLSVPFFLPPRGAGSGVLRAAGGAVCWQNETTKRKKNSGSCFLWARGASGLSDGAAKRNMVGYEHSSIKFEIFVFKSHKTHLIRATRVHKLLRCLLVHVLIGRQLAEWIKTIYYVVLVPTSAALLIC